MSGCGYVFRLYISSEITCLDKELKLPKKINSNKQFHQVI